MDARLGARHPLVRHRPTPTAAARARRSSAAGARRAARGPRAHDEGLPLDGRRPGRPRPRARPDPAAARRQPRAARRRPRSTSTSRTSPTRTTPLAETIARLRGARATKGLIGAWGLSNYDAAGIEEALRHGRPALVQNSLLAARPRRRADVLPLCAEHGIAYVPVRAARRRLADRQVPARRGVPGKARG